MPIVLLKTSSSPRKLLACVLFLVVHAGAALLFARHVELVSNAIQEALVLAATASAIACARGASADVRSGWIFLAVAFADWAIGVALSTWIDLTTHVSQMAVGIPDFLFFFYGAALLFAVTWSEEGTPGWLGFAFDALQSLLASVLVYVAIFNAVPFSGEPRHPIGALLLIDIYDLENAAFVLLAIGRFIGRVPTSARWHYDRVTLIFTVTYGVAASLYNHVFNVAGLGDLIVDMPFLLFILTASGRVRPPAGLQPRRSIFALLVDSAGPTLFTLAVLIFGALVTRTHPILGTVSLVSALTLYGVRAALLQARMLKVQTALAEARDRLERLSFEDGLTGIANRRHFDLTLAAAWAAGERTGRPLSMLLLDVDHFKSLNDHHGHAAGDECLRRIAAALRGLPTRPGGLVARFGGEEFAVILPDTDLLAAGKVAERLRETVAALTILDEPRRSVTLSVGVASTSRADHPDAAALVDAADRALYAAKQSGRNRVALAGAPVAVASSPAEPEPIAAYS